MKNYELVIHPADEPVNVRRMELVGTLDSHTVLGFEKSVGTVLEEGAERVLLNLEHLTYISSAGISALMGLTYKLRQRNGELVLIKPSEKVYRVFRTLGFTNIFRIVDSEANVNAVL